MFWKNSAIQKITPLHAVTCKNSWAFLCFFLPLSLAAGPTKHFVCTKILCDFPTEIDDGVCWVANVLAELSGVQIEGRSDDSAGPTYSEFVISSSKRADKYWISCAFDVVAAREAQGGIHGSPAIPAKRWSPKTGPSQASSMTIQCA